MNFKRIEILIGLDYLLNRRSNRDTIWSYYIRSCWVPPFPLTPKKKKNKLYMGVFLHMAQIILRCPKRHPFLISLLGCFTHVQASTSLNSKELWPIESDIECHTYFFFCDGCGVSLFESAIKGRFIWSIKPNKISS